MSSQPTKAPRDPHLPVEVEPQTFSPRKAAFIVVGLGVALLAMNFAAGKLLDKYSDNLGYRVVAEKWKRLKNDKPSELLVLGDSSGLMGVDTKVLQQQTGLPAKNYCTIAFMLVVNDALMLEQYLKKNPPPKAVVLVHVFDIWGRQPNGFLMERIPLDFGQVEKESKWLALDDTVKEDMVLARYFPLYTESRSTRTLLFQLATGHLKPDPLKKSLDEYGFFAAPAANEKKVDQDVGLHLADIRGKKFAMADANRKALERIVELSNRYGFRLYLANSPLNDQLWQSPELRTYYSQVTQQVGEIMSRAKNGRYLFLEPKTFPASQMQNADHLVKESAPIYTMEIAKELASDGISAPPSGSPPGSAQ